MTSNGNIRVKTLDKKSSVGTSFLLVGVVIALLLLLLALFGAMVMWSIEYLYTLGIVSAELDYIESVGFGAVILGFASILGAVWNGPAKS
jgi:hypothetical protein